MADARSVMMADTPLPQSPKSASPVTHSSSSSLSQSPGFPQPSFGTTSPSQITIPIHPPLPRKYRLTLRQREVLRKDIRSRHNRSSIGAYKLYQYMLGEMNVPYQEHPPHEYEYEHLDDQDQHHDCGHDADNEYNYEHDNDLSLNHNQNGKKHISTSSCTSDTLVNHENWRVYMPSSQLRRKEWLKKYEAKYGGLSTFTAIVSERTSSRGKDEKKTWNTSLAPVPRILWPFKYRLHTGMDVAEGFEYRYRGEWDNSADTETENESDSESDSEDSMDNGEEERQELLLSRSIGQEMSGLSLGDLELGVGNGTEKKSTRIGSDYSDDEDGNDEKAEEKDAENGDAQEEKDQNAWSDGLKRVLSVFKKTPLKQAISLGPDQHSPASPSEKEAVAPPTTPTISKTTHSPHDIYKYLLGNTDPSPPLPPSSAPLLQSYQTPNGNSSSSSSPPSPSPTPLPTGVFHTKRPWRPTGAPTTNPNPTPSPYTYTSTTTTPTITIQHSRSTHLHNSHPSLLSPPPGLPQTPRFPPPAHENQYPNTPQGPGPEVAIWSTLASSLPSPLPFDPLSPTSSILRQNALNRMAQLDYQAVQAVRQQLAREKNERERRERAQGAAYGSAADPNLGPAHGMSTSPFQTPASGLEVQPHSPVEIARASTVSYQRIGGQGVPQGNGNDTSTSPTPSQDRSRSRSRDSDQEIAGMLRGADEIDAGHLSSSSSSSASSISSSAKPRLEMRRRLQKQKRYSSRQTGGTLTQRENGGSHGNEHGRSADFPTDPFADMSGKDCEEDDGEEDDIGSAKSKPSAKLHKARLQPE